jgi:dihydrodipicolinate synthase/N-acetylneuraminate lyase
MPVTSTDLITDPIAHYPSATVACFDPTRGGLPRRQLDEGRTLAFLERLAEEGVPGVLIGSSTGQGHLRTVDELAQWIRCAARARLGRTVRMALLRPEDGPAANATLLDLCAENGYPVVFLRPGTGLAPDTEDRAVVAQLAPLVAAAAQRGLAVGLYSIPDVSGVALRPGAVAALLTGEGGGHIVAVKVTEADYKRSTARFLAHPDLSRLKIVQGWDPHLVRALRDGAGKAGGDRRRTGVTSGLMSLALHQYQHLLAAADAGDWTEAERALEPASALFLAMQDDPEHFADLQRAKYIMGLGHPMTGSVTPEQAERLLATLEGLPETGDRSRLARSLDIMGDGPYHARLATLYGNDGA